MAEPTRGRRWGKVHLRVVSELAPEWKAIGVYVVLCSYADGGGVAWPLQSTVAEHLHVSVSTVRRALRVLEAKGVITTRQVVGRGAQLGRNEYVIAALA